MEREREKAREKKREGRRDRGEEGVRGERESKQEPSSLQRARLLTPYSDLIPIPVLNAPPCVPIKQNAVIKMHSRTPLHNGNTRP